jgi:hypothetical protein
MVRFCRSAYEVEMCAGSGMDAVAAKPDRPKLYKKRPQISN